MLKLVNIDTGKEEAFLYSKTIPRSGDILLKNGKYYRVEDVIFDDDEGDITVVVGYDIHRNNGFSHVREDTMNMVKQLLNKGEKLEAAKLLYKASGSRSLKEVKEFCNNFQN